MSAGASPITSVFRHFVDSERAGGVLLVGCTILSLIVANSTVGSAYVGLWHAELGGLSVEHWINDGLMAVFFLLIGLELERELYVGELSDVRNALLPVLAAAGGALLPALVHLALNAGTPTQAGMGIPMATDIAFALAVLSLLGERVPVSLKVFLTALAVIDDLIAIGVIAMFYSATIELGYLIAAAAAFAALVAMNRLRVMSLPVYFVGGIVLWALMVRSGVHATVAGVLLAFAIPFRARVEGEHSPSHRLEEWLHKPVAFLVLPVFALANTALVLGEISAADLVGRNGLGIAAGLLLGKPIGILGASVVAVSLGLCRLPDDLGWRHVAGVGFVGGIGFTMSIFVTNLAFAGEPTLIAASKLSILLASVLAGAVGYSWLRWVSRGAPAEVAG